jgi:hypothetical protein
MLLRDTPAVTAISGQNTGRHAKFLRTQEWGLRFADGALYSNPTLFEEGNDV